MFNTIGQGVILASVLWLGKTTVDQTVSLATLQAQMKALTEVVSIASADRYNKSQATSDWRAQGLVDAGQAREIERVAENYSNWVSTLSARMGAIERKIQEAE